MTIFFFLLISFYKRKTENMSLVFNDKYETKFVTMILLCYIAITLKRVRVLLLVIENNNKTNHVTGIEKKNRMPGPMEYRKLSSYQNRDCD